MEKIAYCSTGPDKRDYRNVALGLTGRTIPYVTTVQRSVWHGQEQQPKTPRLCARLILRIHYPSFCGNM
jgi:hypothetical protein